MSSSADDYEHDLRSGETPALRVRIRQAFALSSREVTNKQFRAFLAATRQQPKYSCATQGVDDEPVRCVTSQDAERYLLWLSARSGRRYRLPSESELEFALRAGTDTARFWSGRDSHEGISISRACDFCNVKDVTGRAIASPGSWARCTDGFLGLAPVAQFSANL
ncbi:MAG: formylglycine-generating enzyme family protein [Gammaproteobacteria bacterium]|nr:formylglycine-generating enzyme family protein [Gammaproteobacteria bacterium]